MKLLSLILIIWTAGASAAIPKTFNSQNPSYGWGRVVGQSSLPFGVIGPAGTPFLRLQNEDINVQIVDGGDFITLKLERRDGVAGTVSVPKERALTTGVGFAISGRDMVPKQNWDVNGIVFYDFAPGSRGLFSTEKSCDFPIRSRVVTAGRQRFCGDRRMSINETTCRGVYRETGTSEQVQQRVYLSFRNRLLDQEIARVATSSVSATRLTITSKGGCHPASDLNITRSASSAAR